MNKPNQPIPGEWKVRKPVMKFNTRLDKFHRAKCPNCGGRQLMRYYTGPVELYCYECSWNWMR